MNARPSSVTGTNDSACSTIAAPTAVGVGDAEERPTAMRYIAWNPPTCPGVGTATPTTRSVITRNEPR